MLVTYRMTPMIWPFEYTMGAETDRIRSPVVGLLPTHEEMCPEEMAWVMSGVFGEKPAGIP
jgi:hypothetical protein